MLSLPVADMIFFLARKKYNTGTAAQGSGSWVNQ
jgi:hypothetical protein